MYSLTHTAWRPWDLQQATFSSKKLPWVSQRTVLPLPKWTGQQAHVPRKDAEKDTPTLPEPYIPHLGKRWTSFPGTVVQRNRILNRYTHTDSSTPVAILASK